MKDYRPELAEFLGVFALVFIGCAAVATNDRFAFLGPVGVAFAFGLTIVVMVYALGHVSGAHLNPAVTLAFTAAGHFPPRRALSYLAAQAAGATAAAFLLVALLPEGMNVGVTRPMDSLLGAAFAYELVVTAFLMLVIMSVATDARASPAVAGLAIGGVIIVGSLAAGPISGGSFNPARSIGPALAAREFGDLWIYLTAPFAGALLGAVLYELLRAGRLAPDRLGPDEALGALGRVRLQRAAVPVAAREAPEETLKQEPKAP